MKRYKQITYRDRLRISELKRNQSFSLAKIARIIGVNRSTISREFKRNSYQDWQERTIWTAQTAQKKRYVRQFYANKIRRGKKPKTVSWVREKILAGWSPKQIAGRSKIDGPESVSHEYVYNLLYRERKDGGTLHRSLKRYRKRKQRFNPRVYTEVIPERRDIKDRPDIVNKRTRIGDLEGDLVIGYKSNAYLLTLVDRTSRKCAIHKLQTKKKAEVLKALVEAVRSFKIAHTLTLDNGREFTAHRELTKATGVTVYFATPYTSQERGSVENLNGLIRYYLPKKTEFKGLTPSQINHIANRLNSRPRSVLGYLTPNEVHLKHLKNYSRKSHAECCT